MYDEPLSSYISINTINSQDDSYGSPRENIPTSDSYGSPDPVYDEYDNYDDELPSYLSPGTYEAKLQRRKMDRTKEFSEFPDTK